MYMRAKQPYILYIHHRLEHDTHARTGCIVSSTVIWYIVRHLHAQPRPPSHPSTQRIITLYEDASNKAPAVTCYTLALPTIKVVRHTAKLRKEGTNRIPSELNSNSPIRPFEGGRIDDDGG